MTKQFMVVGDVHGDSHFAAARTMAAGDRGIDTIYQVGDFGLWDHMNDGVRFLDELDELSADKGVTWYFVPGNHENYDSLESYSDFDERGFKVIRPNIRAVDRVNVWVDNNVRFAAVGGAVSIDRHHRTIGSSWWPQEMTSIGDVYDLESRLAGKTAAVLLTHDAPSWMPTWPGFIKDDWMSNSNRMMMNSVWEAAYPWLWVHGHYHRHMEYRFGPTKVLGLSCNDRAAGYWDQVDDEPLVNYAIVDYSPNLATQEFEVMHPKAEIGHFRHDAASALLP